jgi:hypothetical protein
MLQKNIAHVLYAIENIELSSMPKIVIFHVFYAISIILTIRGIDAISGPSMGPHVSGKGKNPLLPHQKFQNLTPNSTTSLFLTPNSRPLQNLTPRSRILSRKGTHPHTISFSLHLSLFSHVRRPKYPCSCVLRPSCRCGK